MSSPSPVNNAWLLTVPVIPSSRNSAPWFANACVSDTTMSPNGSMAMWVAWRSSDGVLVLANKNVQPAFTGANLDLLPYCNQEVEVDGLLVGLPEYTPAKMYQVQLIRRKGEAEWSKTNRWTKEWAAANPEAAEAKGPWFRKDPRINALIERDGYLGLGLEKDAAFKKYLFEE